MDDLRSLLKTTGFSSGGQDSPLKEFKGVLSDYERQEKSFGEGDSKRISTSIELKFVDVEVIETSEPWEFPICSIRIPLSGTLGTRWAIFGESIHKMAGVAYLGVPDGKEMELEDGSTEKGPTGAFNLRLHLKKTPGHMLYDGREQKRVAQDAWECMGVEGGKAAAKVEESVELQLLRLLHGKTEQQFNMDALRLDLVKRNPQIQAAILNRSFIPGLVAQGLVGRGPDDIYLVSEGVRSALGLVTAG